MSVSIGIALIVAKIGVSREKELTYLKNYKKTPYLVKVLNWIFPSTNTPQLLSPRLFTRKRPREKAGTLTLDGIGLELLSIEVDGQPWSEEQFKLVPDQLVITHLPDSFELTLTTCCHQKQTPPWKAYTNQQVGFYPMRSRRISQNHLFL